MNYFDLWAPGFLVESLVSFSTAGCHNGPKFLETCFEVLETSSQAKIHPNFPKICTNFPKICTNFPKIFTKFPKIVTNFPKMYLKNLVMRFLNNFRIYGTHTHPSLGLYNDTARLSLVCALWPSTRPGLFLLRFPFVEQGSRLSFPATERGSLEGHFLNNWKYLKAHHDRSPTRLGFRELVSQGHLDLYGSPPCSKRLSTPRNSADKNSIIIRGHPSVTETKVGLPQMGV